MNKEHFELWESLKEQGLISGDFPEETTIPIPWFTKAITIFGAWFAALFLCLFLGSVFVFMFENEIGGWIVGTTLLMGSAYMFRIKDASDFVTNMTLPICLVGQLSLAFGIGQTYGRLFTELAGLAFTFGLVQIGLLFLIKNYIHRVWSTIVASLCFGFLFDDIQMQIFTQPMLFGILTYIWFHKLRLIKFNTLLEPIGYGLILSLIGFTIALQSNPLIYIKLSESFNINISEILIGVVFLVLVFSLLKRFQQNLLGTISISCFSISLLLVFFSCNAVGITASFSFLLLGFLNRNKALMGLGVVSLTSFVSFYYYILTITLLAKSISLGIVSIVFLAIRSVLKRSAPDPDTKESHHAS